MQKLKNIINLNFSVPFSASQGCALAVPGGLRVFRQLEKLTFCIRLK